MATTGSGGSHSHGLRATQTLAAGSHTHAYTDLVGTGPAGPAGPPGVPGPAGPVDPTLAARIDALEARVAALEAPPPPPLVRPFPAPVTTRTAQLPASIDATGATDASAAVNAWVAAQPDGSRLIFPPGAVLRLSQGISMSGRRALVFEGNGATLRLVGAGADQLASGFVLGHAYGGFWGAGGTDVAINGFRIVGNSPTPGVFVAGREGQAGFEVEASVRVEITDCSVEAVWGDGIKVGDASESIWWHDNIVRTAGRNGVTITSGMDVVAERNLFDRSGYCVFDAEPNVASEIVRRAVFRANTAGTWGNAFAAVEGSHTGATIDGVTIAGNTVTDGSLRTIIDNGGTSRMRAVEVSGNIGRGAAGPVFRFAHIDGLIVRGNVQPLLSGTLMSVTDCTEMVTA